MTIVRRMISDISGTEAPESNFVTMIVRHHPAVTSPKALDVLASELVALDELTELVTLEIGNREKKVVVVTLNDFRTLVPDEVVIGARPTRGRRPGHSPKR